MRHLFAFVVSTSIAFATSALLLVVGWRLETLDLFAGVATGLALGFIGASVFLSPGLRAHRRPGPARYALAGGVMGGANFAAAAAAVLLQPWLQTEAATSLWMRGVMLMSGGWMLAKAAADPGRILVIGTASVVSGLIAGWVYGAALRPTEAASTSRSGAR